MSSMLARFFSSRMVRGNYRDEEPEVAFKLQGSRQEQKRLAALVNRIARQSPTGKEILKEAADEGYTLCFGEQLMTVGYCTPYQKRLVLNPMFSDARLVSTLTHESRHAGQIRRGMPDEVGLLEFKAEVIAFRAMEADANACAGVVCHELSRRGDDTPWKAFDESCHIMTLPLRHCREETVPPENVTRSFLAWYAYREHKECYEQSYIRDPIRRALRENRAAELPYSRPMTTAEIVRRVCTSPKGCYFSASPKTLEGPEYADISQETKNEVEAFMASCGRSDLADKKTSVAWMPLRLDEKRRSPALPAAVRAGYLKKIAGR